MFTYKGRPFATFFFFFLHFYSALQVRFRGKVWIKFGLMLLLWKISWLLMQLLKLMEVNPKSSVCIEEQGWVCECVIFILHHADSVKKKNAVSKLTPIFSLSLTHTFFTNLQKCVKSCWEWSGCNTHTLTHTVVSLHTYSYRPGEDASRSGCPDRNFPCSPLHPPCRVGKGEKWRKQMAGWHMQ